MLSLIYLFFIAKPPKMITEGLNTFRHSFPVNPWRGDKFVADAMK